VARKKETSAMPKYNVAQNVGFMVKLAWTTGEKKILALGLLSALLAVGLNLIQLYLSPTILSVVARPAKAIELVWTILGFVLALMLVSAISAYVDTNALFGRVSLRSEITSNLNLKAATTAYPNVDNERFMKLLTKAQMCVGSNSAATEAVWLTLTGLSTNLIGFGIYVSLLSTVQPLLILVILVTTIGGYFVSNYANGYGYRHREEEAEYEMQMLYLDYRAKETATAKDIRIFGLQPWINDLYGKAAGAYRAFQDKYQGVLLWAKLVDLVLAFLRNGVAYAYLIGMVLRGGIDISSFLLLFNAVGGFSAWVTGILEGFTTLHKQSLDIAVVRECLDFPEPFLFEKGETIKAEPGRSYEIRMENLSFRYPGAEEDTLTNIDLTLHPGEKLAVVGLNGAGKTTLIKLLCGFLDPTEGRVLLDGKDIREYNRRDYYAMFSAVFQNFSLLAGSVAANVAQDMETIDMDRVKECVEKAGLRETIEALKDGYETNLNREVFEDAILLSGGEMQRLMLARALYKETPFVLLDEPTAALDPIAESEIYHKYREMTGGKSSVYISHRLASTRFCDRIILIADGRIAEEGTHEELMKLGGRYAEFYEVQSQYYQEEAKDEK